MFRKIVNLILICAFFGSSASWSQSLVPARLITTDAIEPLQCAREPGETSALFCHVVVSESGDVARRDGARCYSNSRNDGQCIRSLERNLEDSKFEPARVYGEPVPVTFALRVLFREVGDTSHLLVLPNLGFEQERLGADYSAPQEILSDGGWLRRLFNNTLSLANFAGAALSVSVGVDIQGRASGGRIELNDLLSRRLSERAIRELEASKFIPAMSNGQPQEARYFEHFSARRGWAGP